MYVTSSRAQSIARLRCCDLSLAQSIAPLLFFFALRLDGLKRFFPTAVAFDILFGDKARRGIVHEYFLHGGRLRAPHQRRDMLLEFIYTPQRDDTPLVDDGDAITQRLG